MKLYYAPGACSLSPHIALCESGLDFEIEKVDLAAKRTESGADYWQINPKGSVPALVLDQGEVLTEGPAVVQYIADLAPDSHLAPPAGDLARYHLMEWLNFITAEIHKPFSTLFNRKAPAECKAMARTAIEQKFDYMDRILTDRAFVTGAGFTVADGYLLVMARWAHGLKFDLARWPSLLGWEQRVLQRPKVQDALRAEGLS